MKTATNVLYVFLKAKWCNVNFWKAWDTCTPKRIEIRVSKIYVYTHVHNSISHNSQNVAVTQESIDRGMDEQNVANEYDGILSSLEKEGNSDTLHYTDES